MIWSDDTAESLLFTEVTEIKQETQSMVTNRRKEPRYPVRDGAYAIDSHEPQRFGEILNISRSGIAFRYLDGHNNYKPATELGIFSSAHRIFVDSISFETISDFQISGHPTSRITMRRHSGRFSALTRQQEAELERFIQLHSMKPSQPSE